MLVFVLTRKRMFILLFYCFIQYKRWRSEAFLWEIWNNAEFCCVAYTIVDVHFTICGYSVKSQHFIWTNKDFRIFHLLLKKNPVWFCSCKQIQSVHHSMSQDIYAAHLDHFLYKCTYLLKRCSWKRWKENYPK